MTQDPSNKNDSPSPHEDSPTTDQKNNPFPQDDTDDISDFNVSDTSLFREGAEEKFVSPDDLDRLINIVKPKEWIGLALMSILTLMFFGWLFLGKINTDSFGKGIILSEKGLSYLYSTASGVIQNAPFTEGQIVSTDTIIAYIYDQNYLNNLNNQAKVVAAMPSSSSNLAREKQTLENLKKNPVLIPIYAEVSGEIIGKFVTDGYKISPGDKIALVKPAKDPNDTKAKKLIAYAFFDIDTGSRIQAGMNAFISLTNYLDPKYGSIIGKVVYVNPYSFTSADYLQLLSKDQNFGSFVGIDTPKITVRIEIEPDPKDPTGYLWTSGKGPNNISIAPELCIVQVKIDEIQPIKYLFPN